MFANFNFILWLQFYSLRRKIKRHYNKNYSLCCGERHYRDYGVGRVRIFSLLEIIR